MIEKVLESRAEEVGFPECHSLSEFHGVWFGRMSCVHRRSMGPVLVAALL